MIIKNLGRIILSGFILFFMIGVKGSYGQAEQELEPKVIPPAPTAASLIKFAEIPVGKYTGTPHINLPIWTAKGRELSADISLSYHAGGVKVSEISGWVGLGWALNAGGVISRTMRGLPDEHKLLVELTNVEEIGNYWEGPGAGYFQVGKFLQNGFYVDGLSCDKKTKGLIKLAMSKGNVDTELDLFSFNFAGRTGKFVFGVDEQGNRSVHMMPQQDLLIEEKIEGENLVAFEVVDENGIRYVFNEREETWAQAKIYTSSWYLSEIISSNGTDVIEFKYDDDVIDYGYQESQTVYTELLPSMTTAEFDRNSKKKNRSTPVTFNDQR